MALLLIGRRAEAGTGPAFAPPAHPGRRPTGHVAGLAGGEDLVPDPLIQRTLAPAAEFRDASISTPGPGRGPRRPRRWALLALIKLMLAIGVASLAAAPSIRVVRSAVTAAHPGVTPAHACSVHR